MDTSLHVFVSTSEVFFTLLPPTLPNDRQKLLYKQGEKSAGVPYGRSLGGAQCYERNYGDSVKFFVGSSCSPLSFLVEDHAGHAPIFSKASHRLPARWNKVRNVFEDSATTAPLFAHFASITDNELRHPDSFLFPWFPIRPILQKTFLPT